MNKPLISILTPTYNHEAYLGQALDSVINQTYPYWEVIIIDDGSTDNTGKVALEYAQKESRIKYFHQSNIGLYRLEETYNFALQKSSGNLIAILEGDDFWDPGKLEKQVDVFEKHPNIVLSWGRVMEYIDGQVGSITHPKTYTTERRAIFNNETPAKMLDILLDDFPVPLTWLISKKALMEIGGFNNAHSMPSVDRLTLYNLSMVGKFHYTDDILGYYRRSRNQATRKFTIELTESSVNLIEDFYNKLPVNIKATLRIDNKIIKKLRVKAITIGHFRKGRFHLLEKDFSEAKKEFIYCLKIYPFQLIMWKLKSLIGILLSIVGWNFETIAKVFGKPVFENYN